MARALRELPPDARWEIDEGRLEMHAPPGPYHADAAGEVGAALHAFVRERGLGRVLVGDPGFHLARRPDVLRAPDIAFVSNARLAQIRDPEAFAEVPPDLAVEILSPGDRPGAVRRKVAQYLDLGVGSVWVVEPRARRLEAHRLGAAVRVFAAEGDVVEDPALPGFRCRLGGLLPEPWPQQ